jgi:hypothetical protein
MLVQVEKSLPPKNERILRIEMTPLQKQYYKVGACCFDMHATGFYLLRKNNQHVMKPVSLSNSGKRLCCSNQPYMHVTCLTPDKLPVVHDGWAYMTSGTPCLCIIVVLCAVDPVPQFS